MRWLSTRPLGNSPPEPQGGKWSLSLGRWELGFLKSGGLGDHRPATVADVRSSTPGGPRGRRGYIRGDAHESPHPRSRRPVQPVHPVSGLPPPRELNKPCGGGGRGAKGRGWLLKGPWPLPLGHFLGVERTSAAVATTSEGVGAQIPRLLAASITDPGTSQLDRACIFGSQQIPGGSPSSLISCASISWGPYPEPGPASDWSPNPCVDSPTATAICSETRKVILQSLPCARHRHLLVGFRKPAG
jgi:hypothetical protein